MTIESIKVDDDVLEQMRTLTLLCVEDDHEIQLLYNYIFKEFFQEIVFAENGKVGYEKYLHENVDIIISDYSMPILNGLDMIKQIRTLDKDIPIILVTAVIEVGIIVKALQFNVSNFLRKPIKANELINALTTVSKLIIANKFLQEQKNSRMQELEAKDKYNSYQEDLAFEKELNILRNDFYYQMTDMNCIALVDFSYQPLDILSGDAYCARKIDRQKTFYLIVDGMGKGLSASLSSMLITSFINYKIDKMLRIDDFDLDRLIHESLKYIKPILLEEETLSIDFIILDSINNEMRYAKFAMPVSLLQTKDDKIVKLRSNNPPVSRYIKEFNIASYSTLDITKFLFYSDGMVENTTRFKGKLYIDFVEDDFLDSFTKENMKEKLHWKIGVAEDDITFIFIHKLYLDDNMIAQKSFLSTLDEVDAANEWYTSVWHDVCEDTKHIYNAGVVFTELFMNAYEHGNLNIDAPTKHKLLDDDIYLETLLEVQTQCNKKIHVSINKIKYGSSNYIITQISDEGEGFDTQILSKIFRNSRSFNGRGVFVSRNSSLGIYYNNKGNSVLFLHKI